MRRTKKSKTEEDRPEGAFVIRRPKDGVGTPGERSPSDDALLAKWGVPQEVRPPLLNANGRPGESTPDTEDYAVWRARLCELMKTDDPQAQGTLIAGLMGAVGREATTDASLVAHFNRAAAMLQQTARAEGRDVLLRAQLVVLHELIDRLAEQSKRSLTFESVERIARSISTASQASARLAQALERLELLRRQAIAVARANEFPAFLREGPGIAVAIVGPGRARKRIPLPPTTAA